MISPSDAPALALGGFTAGGSAAGWGVTGVVGRENAGAASCGRRGGTLGTAGANCSGCEGALRWKSGGVTSVWGFTAGVAGAGVAGAGGSAEGSSSCAMFDRKPFAGRSSSGPLLAFRFRGWFDELP